MPRNPKRSTNSTEPTEQASKQPAKQAQQPAQRAAKLKHEKENLEPQESPQQLKEPRKLEPQETPQVEEDNAQLEIPSVAAGRVIGRKGAFLRSISSRTGCSVRVEPAEKDAQVRKVCFSGNQPQIAAGIKMVTAAVQDFMKSQTEHPAPQQLLKSGIFDKTEQILLKEAKKVDAMVSIPALGKPLVKHPDPVMQRQPIVAPVPVDPVCDGVNGVVMEASALESELLKSDAATRDVPKSLDQQPNPTKATKGKRGAKHSNNQSVLGAEEMEEKQGSESTKEHNPEDDALKKKSQKDKKAGQSPWVPPVFRG